MSVSEITVVMKNEAVSNQMLSRWFWNAEKSDRIFLHS